MIKQITMLALMISFFSLIFCIEFNPVQTCAESISAVTYYHQEPATPTLIEIQGVYDYHSTRAQDMMSFIPMTDREADLLTQIAMSEAGNQGLYGKALVMCVVLNRVRKNNTDIETEIFKPGQFATANMCRGDYEAYEAVDLVRNGWDESQGAIYFCSQGYNACGKEHLFRYKDHWFSK